MKSRVSSVAVVFVIMLAVGGMEVRAACPSADVSGDCRVDLTDLAIMASEWLDDGEPLPVLYGMTWVSINDSGAGMKDEYGYPVSHGGFTGEMSKYETTNTQYCQFLNAAKTSGDIIVDGDHVQGASGPYSGQNYYYLAGLGYTVGGATNGGAARINYTNGVFSVESGFENHPVTYVNWYGSTAFANYYGCRLPSEWEWQAVADYNGSYTYGCGSSLYDAQNFLANYLSNGDDSSAPNDLPYHPWVVYGASEVGHLGTFGYGMADVAGNVFEWTATFYPGDYRVFRGGGWSSYGNACTVSARNNYGPDGTSYAIGFRVCR